MHSTVFKAFLEKKKVKNGHAVNVFGHTTRAAPKVMQPILLCQPHEIKGGCWWYGNRG